MSAWILVAISIERYRAIKRPFAQPLSNSKIFLCMISIILLACCLGAPAVKTEVIDGMCSYEISFLWTLLLFAGNAVLPITLLCIDNTLTMRELNRQTRLLTQANDSAIDPRRLEKNKAIMKTLIIMICVFFILFIPFSVCFLYTAYLQNHNKPRFDKTWMELYLINDILFWKLIFNS